MDLGDSQLGGVEGVEFFKFSQCGGGGGGGGIVIVIKPKGGENFEEMQFDHLLQLGTEECFMSQKSLYLTWNICLSFCASSCCKSVTFCKMCRMSRRGEESFLNFDNVGLRGRGGV